jgi:hypothetical protein
MIRYGYQDIIQADNDAVLAVLKSVNLTQDSAIEQFKQSVAANSAAQQAVAVKALDLDLGLGEWLWATPNTYLFETKHMPAAKGGRLQRFVAFLKLAGVALNTAASRLSPSEERLTS